MKTLACVVSLTFLLIIAGCMAGDESIVNETSSSVWDESSGTQNTLSSPVTLTGFSTPESAVHDPIDDVYFVSNINGHPFGLDENDGFISRIDPGGTIIDLKWIDGEDENVTLRAPKGITIFGDVLYVSDVDAMRMFDRATGEPIGEIPIEPEPDLLNDIGAGPNGVLYMSDSGLDPEFNRTFNDALFKIDRDGNVETIASGEELACPNGVVALGSNVFVVSFCSNIIYRVNPSGKLFSVAELPEGGLDGVVRLTDGTLLVSSWDGSAIYSVSPNRRSIETLITGVTTPADIGYDDTRNTLLIPLFAEDEVVLYPL